LDPVDDNEAEDNSSNTSESKSITGKLESVLGARPDAIGTECEKEASNGSQSDDPPHESRVSGDSFRQTPSIRHVSVPFTLFTGPIGESTEVNISVNLQVNSRGGKIGGKSNGKNESNQ
jgi:hypothetical protein